MGKKASKIYHLIIVQTLLCCWINLPLSAQSPLLQQLSFKDPILEKNLRYFVYQTKAKITNVLMEKRDSAYLYQLSSPSSFNQVEQYSTAIWGQWHNQIVIITGGAELKEVCLVTNLNPFSHLLTYLHSELSPTKQSLPSSRLTFTFKVKDGQEEWFKDNDGYDSRDFPHPK
ncbi:hypothetical protein [Spirosoma endophyticum]|uniref:Uncharacterized protein n=1 Tax=Spirosoma endophyticum TaxID=662367 RepID=A0A1I2I4I6_9BACT|nr:hypothetical protein [Spirosoma endophyticum]SFF35826.1 hypothetical protein SAMN05216167_15315 [Spirosoma endophyticum]